VKRKFRVGLHHIEEPYRTLVYRLLRALLKRWGGKLVSLVVFGSVARGDARKDSDIDLLIIAKELPRSRFRRQEMFEEAESEVEHLKEVLWSRGYTTDLSPVILSVEEAKRHRPLYLDMVEDAVVVYDKDGFMQRILSELTERLQELGAERVWVGKKWYWRLKKDYKPGEVIEL